MPASSEAYAVLDVSAETHDALGRMPVNYEGCSTTCRAGGLQRVTELATAHEREAGRELRTSQCSARSDRGGAKRIAVGAATLIAPIGRTLQHFDSKGPPH